MKFVPVAVSVNAAPPAIALVGLMEVSVGTGLFAALTVNVEAAEVPPPGAGFVTVTGKLPTAAMSATVIAAVTWVALTKVVVRAFPLNFTEEVETKPVPFTVRVKAAPPAVAPFGESEVIVGAGLLIVKVCAPEVPPPGAGLVTVTFTEPAVAMSVARIAAVICVALTKVVALAAPLKFTTDEELKFVPFTVSVKPAPPAVALVGEIDVVVGTGLLTGKFMGAEGPPPGAGLLTMTGKDPAAAMSAAVTAMVTCVAETNVMVLAVPLKVPVAPLTKFVPLMVSVKPAPPAVALVGENEVIVGTGLLAPGVNERWKLVVPPSPRNDETIKKYWSPDVAAKDTCDCAIPAVASLLHVTCVPAGVPLVTLRMVS
jgi:xanthosine utilization system XapX-like protein